MKTEILNAENGYIIELYKYTPEEIKEAGGYMSVHDLTMKRKILCLDKGHLLEELAKIYKD